jgi:hypothetical protein
MGIDSYGQETPALLFASYFSGDSFKGLPSFLNPPERPRQKHQWSFERFSRIMDYTYHPLEKEGVFNDEQAKRNFGYASAWKQMRVISDGC